MPDDVAIEGLADSDVDQLASLWKALLDHIAALPGAVVPVRPFEQSWPLERARLLESLAGAAFALTARRAGKILGYALVNVEGPDPVWYTGYRKATLEHLSVAAGERGLGIGSALMDAVDAELERRGVEDMEIGVDAANRDALRFYERRGYRPDYLVCYGSPGGKPWACLRREEVDRRAGRGRYVPPGLAPSNPAVQSQPSPSRARLRPAPPARETP